MASGGEIARESMDGRPAKLKEKKRKKKKAGEEDLHIEGYSIGGLSIAGHETCVILPSLNLAFDIGKCPQRAVSQQFLFISHGHMDHIGGLPMYVATRGLYRMAPPTIIVPKSIKESVEKIFEAHRAMDQSELQHTLVGLDVGEEFCMRKDLKVRAFRTYHVIPSQGYIVYSVRHKLKQEYLGLPGAELKSLKLSGVEITDTYTTPEIAFTGDTMSDFITDADNTDVLRAKILIMESTYVENSCTVEDARDYGHTHLSEIISHAEKFQNKAILLIHFSARYQLDEVRMARISSSKTFNGESEGYLPKNHSLDKLKIIDASYILKHPHRANRPDHIVIILRGLPGSGKSYLAKILRDIEVENGGTAPRIHSMDEYFMTEIEKVEESEGSRSKVSTRGKRPVTRTVMEYCYEPEMEEAYRSSMLKAFKKTLDEGAFPFVIVDDRNLRVADFAQFWATAKRSGYEVYILEATYKDPAGCAARNVHGFTQNDIFKMANQWEDTPSLYMKLDGKSLLHGDDLEENGIEEVDMDMDDGSHISDTSGSEVINADKDSRPSDGVQTTGGPSTDKQKEDGEEENLVEVVKDLGKSKWSNDLDDDDVHKTEATRGNSRALSSLTKSYSKKGKSVRWADQIGRIGFSISAGKTANVSLIIGPGSGYNLKSNPLLEEEKLNQKHTGESRTRNVFQEQLRAERESFRAVFDKRKHRIGGIGADEE